MEASELRKEGKLQKVVVTGCLAQRYSTELAGEVRKLKHAHVTAVSER